MNNAGKVIVVNKVKNIGSSIEGDSKEFQSVLQELMQENDLDMLNEVIPSRNLEKIKEDNLKKVKEDNSIKIVKGPIEGLEDRDLNKLQNILDPNGKIEELESKFFLAKQSYFKNIRTMEMLKEEIYKLYQKIYPNLTVAELHEKFKY